jgi:hypothetical protein
VHFVGILPDESWTEYINNGREKTAENLCICNDATLACMAIWADHENDYFVKLPKQGDDLVDLQKFTEDQDQNITKVKNTLKTTWKENIVKIYKEELQSLTKRQRLTFFRSNAILMSNQIRNLVYDSLFSYRDFMRRFKLETYKDPVTIIKQDKDINGTIEDAFLVVPLYHIDGEICFQVTNSQ